MPEETTVLPTAAHPDPEALAAFARGALPPGELAAVAEHVAGCDACCAALGRVPEDSLAHLARAAAANPPAGDNTPAPVELPPPAGAVPEALADHPRYRILGALGEGGMGVVYKAEHRLMGRVVALKVLAPHLTRKPAAVDRFVREVKAAARLNHPNIVTAHDADEAGGLHFLVMEYVEGVSLERLVARKGPLAIPLACQFARQAALGLQHAHDKGMVHRDVKPANLMVTRKGQVKILDFGLARFARDLEAEGDGTGRKPAVTAPNLVMGTPDYLSPEQAWNSHEVDGRSDVYSLGCTLYFLLTGRVPFPSASTLIDKLLAHTEEAPTPVQALRPEVPDGLAAVVDRMMAKKAEGRYQTPAEAAAALAPFAKGESAGPSPAVTPEPMPLPADAAPFEVVDAVLAVPPAAVDTEPDGRGPGGPTVAEAGPREKKSRPRGRKGTGRPAARSLRRKLATVVGVAILGLLVGAAARQVMRPGTPAGDGDKGRAAAKEPAPTKVLFVVPRFGVWPGDYHPVRERLERGGVTVVTASSGPGPAVPPKNVGGAPVPVDVVLTPDLDVSGYAGVVFCGQNAFEFAPGGVAGPAAKAVIDRMQKGNKAVAAICYGEGVLVGHGVLDGRRAALNAKVRDLPVLRTKPVRWEEKGVVVDGKLVTAAAPENAAEFAETLLRVIGDD